MRGVYARGHFRVSRVSLDDPRKKERTVGSLHYLRLPVFYGLALKNVGKRNMGMDALQKWKTLVSNNLMGTGSN